MEEIIESLRTQIKADKHFGSDPNKRNWAFQNGVILSANEAQQVIDALELIETKINYYEDKIELMFKAGAEQVIDFATWYSGMEREKVEKQYKKYLSGNNLVKP